jgi:uncharacterized protein
MSDCLSCGACCATFRVDFHPAELAGGAFAWAGGVPYEMTLRLTQTLVRMRGTDGAPGVAPRCVALAGNPAAEGGVRCTIYPQRPGPCREFEAGGDACARARRRHGLSPLIGH